MRYKVERDFNKFFIRGDFMVTQREVSLHFFGGGSDKVYHAQIVEVSGGQYNVNFQYGRRGSNLTTGTKNSSPVDLAGAVKIYDKIVKEKTGKGYQVTNSSTSPTSSAATTTATATATATAPEVEVQLLNDVDEETLEKLFCDPNIGAQEKYDGCRMLLRKTNAEIVPFNRRGLRTNVSEIVAKAIESLQTAEIEFDGEIVGDIFYAFDCLALGGDDLRDKDYLSRAIKLNHVLQTTATAAIVRAPLEVTERGKRELFARLKRENKEGIVFKNLKASYTGGRPNSGGNQLKFKFYSEATCRVEKANENRRSVALEVLGADGKYIGIGNCTIPPNHDVPTSGAFVEIRYLYAFGNGGKLYQPTYKGERTDKTEADAYDSLKFKNGTNDDE